MFSSCAIRNPRESVFRGSNEQGIFSWVIFSSCMIFQIYSMKPLIRFLLHFLLHAYLRITPLNQVRVTYMHILFALHWYIWYIAHLLRRNHQQLTHLNFRSCIKCFAIFLGPKLTYLSLWINFVRRFGRTYDTLHKLFSAYFHKLWKQLIDYTKTI